jgi:hypothetical protein
MGHGPRREVLVLGFQNTRFKELFPSLNIEADITISRAFRSHIPKGSCSELCLRII